jgi:hypothetical protein
MSDDHALLTITEIVARLPGARGASRVHPATVVRWITHGCPARDGTRVRLAATRAGSRWLILLADLNAFFAALAADPQTAPEATLRSPVAKTKAAARASSELERRGA